MDSCDKIYRLHGVVQHYSWGGYTFIPNLLGLDNTDRKPFAEYWLGAHPNHSSKAGSSPLNELISSQTELFLGKKVLANFNALPYLFKVLDVRQMLSIQVHPDKASAKRGYELENHAGTPVNAPHRNYKDQNHKPELMVALGEFWLLHGFKEPDALIEILQNIRELNFLLPVFEAKGYKGLYEHVMNMSQAKVNELLRPLLMRITPLYERLQLEKSQEDFWAARAALTFSKDGNLDRGIFSIYFFNLLHLKKGEGIFQPAGMPHAYLEGQNVEVMANSDNVLRAGLTDKHIDVAELMKHVLFEPTIPNVLRPEPYGAERSFQSPASEFSLFQYHLSANTMKFEISAGEIWFTLDGAARLRADGQEMTLQRGEAAFVLPRTLLQADSRVETNLFRVSVPG